MQSGNPIDQRRGQAEALQRARLAIDGDRPADAERIARDILEANAGQVEATKILGYALVMQDKAQDAVGPLEKVARSSRDPEIETQLAIALRQCGRVEKALIWLNRAVKRVPPFPAAFHELGFVLHETDRSGEAIAALRQGLAIAPMMVEMAVQLGFVCYAVNDRANAAAAFAHALSINPLHPEAVQGLATVLMDEGKYAQAAELYRQVTAGNPEDNLARIGLGKCLLELGEIDTAHACLRAATAREPKAFGKALFTLVSSGHGRFWLRPSAAEKFFKGER
jgi:tetratricopeptide (TPR) repeat protein